MKKWTLNSWRDYPVKHIPKYEDEKELTMVLKKVSSFPPLVFAGETRTLKKSLAQVAEGKAFPSTTCASDFFNVLDSPAKTKGGNELTFFRTAAKSFSSSYVGICLTG